MPSNSIIFSIVLFNDRLPAEISVEWPEGNEVENDSKVQAGSTIGNY